MSADELGTDRIDRSAAVRPGEELDAAAVHEWLSAHVHGLTGIPEISQFPGGASNWTYRLRYPEHDLILRRPPAGTRARSAHDMAREFTVQDRLRPVYPYVPRMLALCQDPAVIGTDFYVMERIEGIIPRRRLPDGVRLDAAETRRLCTAVIDRLVDLHAVDFRGAGLESLFRGAGYVRRQVDGWSKRYERARTWNVPTYKFVRSWLEKHAPDDVASRVIHNDWRFDNVVLDAADPTRVIGVFDWEMATIGDPLMELGSALAYWVQADDNPIMRSTRRQPTDLPGMMTRDEVVRYYTERTGLQPANWAFYEVFGLFRLAVIAQQIYFRYFHRQTRNPAFRNFWILINYFDWRCRAIIRRSGV